MILILANSADSDEMQHYAAFHLGLHSLPLYPFGAFHSLPLYPFGAFQFTNGCFRFKQTGTRKRVTFLLNMLLFKLCLTFFDGR